MTRAGTAFLLLLTLFTLAACLSYRPTQVITPGATARINSLEVRVDSLACCARYREKFAEAVLFIRNHGNRPVVVLARDIHLVDGAGNTVPAATGHLVFIPRSAWIGNPPPELVEFERRWIERFATERVVAAGEALQLRVFFPDRVDFDGLSAIRVRDATGGRVVNVPLTSVAR